MGWNRPPFARLENGLVAVEGHAEGALSQWIPKTDNLSGQSVITLGYARVESAEPPEPTDDDVTPKLWEGAVALVNGFSRRWGGMENPYRQIRFTGREVASGAWKRFVAPPVEVSRVRQFYPHFAFWGARLRPGVKLRLAGLALAPAPRQLEEPELWVDCPSLPAPQPVLEWISQRQFDQDLDPDGVFERFERQELPAREPGWQEWALSARYRQGKQRADRFVVAVTEDGSDPRLSPTSRVQTVLVRRNEPWETTIRVRTGSRPVRIAVAAAAQTSGGVRTQTPVFPEPWQKP